MAKITTKKTKTKKAAPKKQKKAVVKKKAAPAAKKSVAKKAASKKSVVKKTVAKKVTAKKTVAKKATAKKTVAKKATAKKAVAKKATAKKAVAKKATAKKAVAKKVTAKKTVAKKVTAKKAVAKKVTAKKAAPKKVKSKSAFKREIFKSLQEAKKKILNEVSDIIKNESSSDKFDIGDIYDIASIERERELSLTLGDRDREKLLEIDEALERLGDKDYGLCEECGEPIGDNRLRALLFTRLCVDCKSKFERQSLSRGRFEENAPNRILEKQEAEDDDI
jgi:RNA polymerase-binding protein DksA